MAKIDLGAVAILPWDNLYPLFDTVPDNFTGNGGYKIDSQKCYACMSGTTETNITLPTPAQTFDLSYYVNGEFITQKDFNGTITNTGNISIFTTYGI